MRRLSLHPAWFAALTFLLGLAIGLTIEQGANDYLEWRRRLAYMRDPSGSVRTHFDALRQLDSIAARSEGEMQPFGHGMPIEIARHQADEHCAITVAFDAASMTGMPLISVRMENPRSWTPLGQAWAYKEHGFYAGDTVTLVVPNTSCSDGIIMGWSHGRANPPARSPLRLLY